MSHSGTLRAANLACLAILAGCADRGARGDPRPDIVMVVVDSLRADHLGCYGYARDTSPTLDRLAREGVLFENATSTTSWTLPAHAAVFTGLDDLAHGVTDNRRRLADAHLTLAEVLRAAGYRTAGFYGAPFLHPSFGLQQGFDVYESYIGSLWEGMDDDEFHSRLGRGELGAVGEVSGPRAVRMVDSWLDGASDDPFFLFVHLWDVHHDYIPPREHLAPFDPDPDTVRRFHQLLRNPDVRPDMEAGDLRDLVACYDGEVRFTDDSLARILESLERHERLDGTVVLFTADHGDEFFEHGGVGHRRTLFEEVLRIPMILWCPGRLEAGVRVEGLVGLTDVMPTLLALAGVGVPAEVRGKDLLPLIRGEPRGRSREGREALIELERTMTGIRTDRYKLIRHRDGETRCFDLEADPQERRPLPADAPEVAVLGERLDALVAEARRFRDGLGRAGADALPLEPEIRRRLQALGYTGEDDGSD